MARIMPMLMLHMAATLFLTGMIWTVQVVHYPLFRLVGPATFVAYESAHARRIAALIVLPWGVQGATTIGLLMVPPDAVSRGLVWLAAVLAVIPVVVTLAVSVPAHGVLAGGFDRDAHARLVRTNWVRTLAWSAHALVAVAMFASVRTA